MKTLFRIILFSSISLFFARALNAQPDYQTQKIRDVEYIQPSMDLLVYFFNQDFGSWKSTMKEMGLSVLDDQENVAIYIQGDQTKQCLAISKNLIGLISFDWFNFISEESLFTEFFDFIKPYYYERSSDIDFHRYRDWIIGIKKVEADGLVQESIWIKKAF